MDINDKYSSGYHTELQGCRHKMLLKGTNCNETIVEQLLICDEVYTVLYIAGKFGGGKVWHIDSFQAFDESFVN